MEGIGKSSKQGGVTTREPKISIANLMSEALVPGETDQYIDFSTDASKKQGIDKMRQFVSARARITQEILGTVSEDEALDIMMQM